MRLRANEPRQARKGAAEVTLVCAVGCLAFFVLAIVTSFSTFGIPFLYQVAVSLACNAVGRN